MKHRSRYLQPKPIILIGPPGSGKGTQAGHLSPALGIPAISTGDMLRHECQSGSSLGRAVQAILASGRLVSDELMNEVIASRLKQVDCERGFILDGYPRTVAQARFLSRLLKNLNMPDPTIFPSRKFPSVRDGTTNPARSYLRNVCGWSASSRDATLIT